ncbi:MAG TPA: DUF3090 family protein [Mycobacteriales bacterium]|jgi:uncharacterized repeat protein (TIGR03847 family)|nr:DUF3090 family protein [Mycobacteriales bacterium]
MSRQVFAFERPTRFIVGTVGQPGEREFYLQAVEQQRVVSVGLEKVQVALLAQRLGELLDEAGKRLGADIPADVTDLVDTDPMVSPVDAEFRVGTLGLVWDSANQAVVVEALAVDEEEVPEEERDLLRVHLTPAQAKAFIQRAAQVVMAGRPPCPLCGQPLEPDGHICPRRNGYRPRGR